MCPLSRYKPPIQDEEEEEKSKEAQVRFFLHSAVLYTVCPCQLLDILVQLCVVELFAEARGEYIYCKFWSYSFF